jgi:hypothetical protein
MAATITRAGTVLHPSVVLGWPLTRTGRSVVHPILNTASVEVTVRPAGPRSGTLDTLWPDQATATAAFNALATAGAPWVWVVPGAAGSPLTAHVLDASIAQAEETGGRWVVSTTVQEVTP